MDAELHEGWTSDCRDSPALRPRREQSRTPSPIHTQKPEENETHLLPTSGEHVKENKLRMAGGMYIQINFITSEEKI